MNNCFYCETAFSPKKDNIFVTFMDHHLDDDITIYVCNSCLNCKGHKERVENKRACEMAESSYAEYMSGEE